MTNEDAKYPNQFVSSFLPTSTSFGSNLRAFQSNFPSPTCKPITVDSSGSDVIVVQLGSRFMKIGFANQAFPHIVPQVLAKPSVTPQFQSTDERNVWEIDEDEIHERIAQRYRQSRRKPPPNVYQSLTNYNRQSEYEEISAHNDAFLMEWTDEKVNKVHVGTAALHLNPELCFKLVWPFQRGTFNSRDYQHVREVVEDLGELIRGAIVQELHVEEFKNYCLVLVLPDSFERGHVKGCVECLMSGQKPFKAISLIQDSQAVSFGCGVSSAVIVDCGAQKISVACVEEGFLVPETKIKLPIGGDDVTRFFAAFLKSNEFPHEFDLRNPLDWELLDELKERTCTVNEAEIAASATIFEFYVRAPNQLTKKLLFKMFEERIIAPLALFDTEMGPFLSSQVTENTAELFIDSFYMEDTFTEPTIEEAVPVAVSVQVAEVSQLTEVASETLIKCNWNKCTFEAKGLPEACDHYNSSHYSDGGQCKYSKCSFSSSDKISLQCHVISSHLHALSPEIVQKNLIETQSKLKEFFDGPMAIDDAVLASLYKLNDTERIRRCASSVILSGGSHLFSGFPDVLFDRLSSKLPLSPLTALVEAKIFPNARDLDARFLAWKGGAVFSKLESTMEAWITKEEWECFGMRSIKEKISFIN